MSVSPTAAAIPTPLMRRLSHSLAQAWRAVRLAHRSAPGALIALCAITVCSAALPSLMAWIAKLILDGVVAAQSLPAAARARALLDVLALVLLEFALLGAQGIAEQGLSLLRTLIGSRLRVQINLLLLEKTLRFELWQFEDAETYDKIKRARRDASSRPLELVFQTFSIIRHALTLAGLIVLLWSFSAVMVLGLLAAAWPAFIAEVKFSTAAFRLAHDRSSDNRRLDYLQHVLGTDQYAKEVKLFDIGATLLRRYQTLAHRLAAEDRRLAFRRVKWTYGLGLLSNVAFYACYAAIVAAAVAGTLSLGTMTLYVAVFRQGQQSFSRILSTIAGMYESVLYVSMMFEVLALPEARPPARVSLRATGERGIRFEGVGFRYPGSDRWVLRGVTLSLPHGQSLALVGQNGAGKTTLIKLLTRLYDPTEGRILLDGQDLATWEEHELRRRISTVFQDYARYQLIMRENVGLGNVAHLTDDLRIWRGLDKAGAREMVQRLTAGLDTQMGTWFPGGKELSGGQWQKIALARAFMREEADIFILDEPTAALDAGAEEATFEQFWKLARGRTAILISHRFSTVRRADRILVVDGGQVTEDGCHEDLLRAGASYARMFTQQARAYR